MVKELSFNFLNNKQINLENKIYELKSQFKELKDKKENIDYNRNIPVLQIYYFLELIERFRQLNE